MTVEQTPTRVETLATLPPADLGARVVAALRAAGLTLAAGESLTAGLLCATVADTPGASAVLRGGLVVYATDLKSGLAGVDGDLLRSRGPVDPDVAAALADGAAARCGADVGVGLTGVAGPDEQDGHPVGEVYIGLHVAGRETVAYRLSPTWRDRMPCAGADLRRGVREATVREALAHVLDALGSPGPGSGAAGRGDDGATERANAEVTGAGEGVGNKTTGPAVGDNDG
ncbi:nicotinamide-nucleotide amidohydrolase family protein [Corynebacterium bovis]|uniref:nicotinamide-nucleotide amidohydrolase family protein n=1 Tax=Corynebacterium bovis TaxID=36808 RepID=UPI003D740C2C